MIGPDQDSGLQGRAYIRQMKSMVRRDVPKMWAGQGQDSAGGNERCHNVDCQEMVRMWSRH